MAVAATAMRQILIGHWRRNVALKRGGNEPPVSFADVERALRGEVAVTPPTADALLALDRALDRLKERSERQTRIVECRFFGGMSIEETAAALGVSPATVKRDWSLAQAWLHREIERELG
jgi:RNA polymerase sigma factor (TIGR02999 family)